MDCEGNCMAPEVMRDIGSLQAKQENMAKQISEMDKKLDDLLDSVTLNKGGIRMLMAIGAVGVTLASAVAWLWEHFQGQVK